MMLNLNRCLKLFVSLWRHRNRNGAP